MSDTTIPNFSPGDYTTLGMTNFDHTIDDGLEEKLRNGMWGNHAAWDFNGIVWFDVAENKFFEQVWRHHHPVGLVSADTLPDLMIRVNEQFGQD